MYVGRAGEVLEQQLAEAQQHATAQEEELQKAKEEAIISLKAQLRRGSRNTWRPCLSSLT